MDDVTRNPPPLRSGTRRGRPLSTVTALAPGQAADPCQIQPEFQRAHTPATARVEHRNHRSGRRQTARDLPRGWTALISRGAPTSRLGVAATTACAAIRE